MKLAEAIVRPPMEGIDDKLHASLFDLIAQEWAFADGRFE